MTRTVLTTGAGSLPVRAAVRIDVTYTDGSSGNGSGYMVGANDVLTASHVLYTQGKTVETVTVYPDILAGSTGYPGFVGANLDFNQVGDGSQFISFSDIGRDYAIIGLSDNLGYSTGWYDITSDYTIGEAVYGVDYGSDYNALEAVYTEGTIESRIINVITHTMEKVPGSSGSAIIRTSDNMIVGVHSANGSSGEYYASGFDPGSFATVQSWINGNNVTSDLLPDDGIERTLQLGSFEASEFTATGNGNIHYYALAGDDVVLGGDGDDIIFGGDGDDTVMGGAGDDFLGGDNTFATPYVGTDLIDGGEGIDTALYLNDRSIYDLTFDADGSISVSGFDRLVSIERIQFADATVRVDIDQAVGAQLYRIYEAMFNRAPDEAGLVYWSDVVAQDISLSYVAERFIDSAEFVSLYGENPTDEDYISALYQNVLGRTPDQDGYAYWVGKLETGDARSAILIGFSESTENTALTADATANGIIVI